VTPPEIVIAVVACLCAAMAGSKLRDLAANPGNRALRLLCASLAAVTLATILQPLAARMDQWVGRLDTTRVVADCLVLIAAECGRSAFLYMSHQQQQAYRVARLRAAALLGCLATLAVLFAITPVHHRLDEPYVLSHAYYAATPPPNAAPYVMVYLAYLTWCAVGSLSQTARYARRAPGGLLRLGLSLLAGGVGITLGYVLVKIAASFAHAYGSAWASTLDTAVAASYGLASALILLGATISSWGPRIGLASAWTNFTARRDCRRLTPLWDLVHGAAPEVTLLPHPRQPTLRRLRMTVEILDGCAQLSQWAPQRPIATGTSERAAAAVEAALIRAAADARLHSPATGANAGTRLCPPENREAGAEVAWLSRISTALRHQRGRGLGILIGSANGRPARNTGPAGAS
jgi:hypothetical protein